MNNVVNFFDYTDEASLDDVSRLVRTKDVKNLRKILSGSSNRRRKKSRTTQTRTSLAVDNRGWTAVHVAASQNECNGCLDVLISYGDEYIELDLNARSFDGKTALFVASEEGCERNVLLLLNGGSDANAKTPDGSSPLHAASAKGYEAIVRHLLRFGGVVDDQDWQGFTALHLAALYGHRAVCEALLESMASTISPDSDGNLALHLACQRGHFGIVRLLLEYEKEKRQQRKIVDLQNNEGITPLMLAVQNCRPDRNDSEKCVEYLLQCNASATIASEDGVCALHYAAVAGNAKIMRTLLKCVQFTDVYENCYRSIESVLKNGGTHYSIVCCALNSASIDCLATIFSESTPLKKEILLAPHVEKSGCCTDVFSPLAYLLSVRCEQQPIMVDDTLVALLSLLLEHDIVFVDAFARELKIKWPSSRINFINPYAVILNSQWSDADKFAILDTLNDFNVTFDYCLQCYNDNTIEFKRFDLLSGYEIFYKPVLDAVRSAKIDAVRIFLSHSSVLEPDLLCRYLIAVTAESNADFEMHRSMYYYLIGLKPLYFNCNSNSSTILFCEYVSKQEEFTRSTLQQLCRNVIRQQLRSVTLLENLRDFRSKIVHLPLPTHLKNYLLFKEY